MKKPKIIAFYLPQYHEIPENSKWWGNGFTEWVNVKSAKPLFKSHYQPKIPYRNNYYDLSNVDVIFDQAKLANYYGVDGFCFYHYWFEGKKLLEKPMEMLLEKPEIKINYCVSWANETWSRRWSGEEKKILIKQTYGGEEDWEKHLQYLLPFFRDPRYIKVDEKPVILLYRAFEIEKCEEMLVYWEERMMEEGFNGIYIVETLNSVQKKGYIEKSSAYVEFEPMYTIYGKLNYFIRSYRYCFNHLKLFNLGFRDYLSYDKVCKKIVSRQNNNDKKTYLGAFPSWDNTARKGKAGLVIKNSSPEKFKDFFSAQYRKSMELNNEFIFINAWNEWGEGAYLEPDEQYKFQILTSIKEVKEYGNET